MHNGPLGTFQLVAGSSLLELCEEGVFGNAPDQGGWAAKLNWQLRAAYGLFTSWARDHCIGHSHPEFKANRIGMHEMRDWPELKV